MRRSGFRTSIVACAVLATVTLVAGPAGARGDATRKIRRAAAAAQASSSRFTFTISASGGGQDGTITADGVTDAQGANGVVTLDMSDMFEADASVAMEERIVDGIAFMDIGPMFDALGRALPDSLAGRHWVRLDLSSLVKGQPGQAEGLDPTGGNNPTSQVGALAGIDDARAVGKATVAGVSTTEYRGTVSRTRAEARLEQMPEEVRDQQRAALEQMFATRSELPVRVWLDDQDQLRRMSMRIEVSGATATVDMTMLEYGVPVDVQAPPAGEVIEYREFQRLAQRPSPNLA